MKKFFYNLVVCCPRSLPGVGMCRFAYARCSLSLSPLSNSSTFFFSLYFSSFDLRFQRDEFPSFFRSHPPWWVECAPRYRLCIRNFYIPPHRTESLAMFFATKKVQKEHGNFFGNDSLLSDPLPSWYSHQSHTHTHIHAHSTPDTQLNDDDDVGGVLLSNEMSPLNLNTHSHVAFVHRRHKRDEQN